MKGHLLRSWAVACRRRVEVGEPSNSISKSRRIHCPRLYSIYEEACASASTSLSFSARPLLDLRRWSKPEDGRRCGRRAAEPFSLPSSCSSLACMSTPPADRSAMVRSEVSSTLSLPLNSGGRWVQATPSLTTFQGERKKKSCVGNEEKNQLPPLASLTNIRRPSFRGNLVAEERVGDRRACLARLPCLHSTRRCHDGSFPGHEPHVLLLEPRSPLRRH